MIVSAHLVKAKTIFEFVKSIIFKIKYILEFRMIHFLTDEIIGILLKYGDNIIQGKIMGLNCVDYIPEKMIVSISFINRINTLFGDCDFKSALFQTDGNVWYLKFYISNKLIEILQAGFIISKRTAQKMI